LYVNNISTMFISLSVIIDIVNVDLVSGSKVNIINTVNRILKFICYMLYMFICQIVW